jgi:hypothetical protein
VISGRQCAPPPPGTRLRAAATATWRNAAAQFGHYAKIASAGEVPSAEHLLLHDSGL